MIRKLKIVGYEYRTFEPDYKLKAGEPISLAFRGHNPTPDFVANSNSGYLLGSLDWCDIVIGHSAGGKVWEERTEIPRITIASPRTKSEPRYYHIKNQNDFVVGKTYWGHTDEVRQGGHYEKHENYLVYNFLPRQWE